MVGERWARRQQRGVMDGLLRTHGVMLVLVAVDQPIMRIDGSTAVSLSETDISCSLFFSQRFSSFASARDEELR
jgi:hypothetical protein